MWGGTKSSGHFSTTLPAPPSSGTSVWVGALVPQPIRKSILLKAKLYYTRSLGAWTREDSWYVSRIFTYVKIVVTVKGLGTKSEHVAGLSTHVHHPCQATAVYDQFAAHKASYSWWRTNLKPEPEECFPVRYQPTLNWTHVCVKSRFFWLKA